MSEVLDRYTTISAAFLDRAANVSADQWSAPTPCSEWTVRDLVAHVLSSHRRMLSTLTGAEVSEAGPDEDLVALVRAESDRVRAALADADQASRVVRSPFGEQPFESMVSNLLCGDTIVHTWDLSRATGQDERLDPAGVERAHAFLSAAGDAIRRPGVFGPAIASAPGADKQTAFLNFAGRAV